MAGGWLSDNVLSKRRKPLMLVSAISTIITMQFLINAPESMGLLAILLFITGFLLALGYSAFSVYVMGRADKETYPVAFSIVNMGGQLGGMSMPLIVGILLDKFNWSAVFLGLSIGAALCLICVLSIIEPLPKGVRVVTGSK
jgi:sugar phosphate permease